MTIHKLKKHQDDVPYTMASREVVQSLTNPLALAIWVYLQSLPENWNVSEMQLRSHFCVGKDRYREAMKVLKEAGLYSVTGVRNDEGKFVGSFYNIYGMPRKPEVRKTGHTEIRPYIKEKNNTKEEDNGFSSFWLNYPNKKNKQAALSAWKKLSKTNRVIACEKLTPFMEGLPEFQRKDFNLHASTYLNGKRWEDEGEVEVNSNAGYI